MADDLINFCQDMFMCLAEGFGDKFAGGNGFRMVDLDELSEVNIDCVHDGIPCMNLRNSAQMGGQEVRKPYKQAGVIPLAGIVFLALSAINRNHTAGERAMLQHTSYGRKKITLTG
ncbi:hypothetical protein [Neisseria shayeganii]|uniref:hypothetical protein n=1 Tax=Neisseria shayeganii TaxID=607712 RepID=UPI001E50F19E|nr:hypothetical protein [Neisseria shayeganii]